MQEIWKKKVMQNFRGQIRCIMGNVEVVYRVGWVARQQARLRQPDWMNEWMNDTNNLSFTIEGLQSYTCYPRHAMHKVQLLLNPSTIDGHGEDAYSNWVSWEWSRKVTMMILKWQPLGAVTLSVTSVEIITDTYQRTSRWKGGLNTKAAKATVHTKVTWAKWLTSVKAL